METNKNEAPVCANCRRKCELGMDVLSVSEGVMGPRGFVRLEETLFCSEECLRAHFGEARPDHSLRRRVP